MTKVGAQAIRRLFGEVVCSVAAVTDAATLELSAGLMDRVHDGADALPPAELVARLQGKAGALTTGSERIDAALLAACPGLKIVANMAVGFNNFDVPAMTAHGVLATNTPDVLTETTADFGFALVLADSDIKAASGGLLDESHTLSQLIGRPTTPIAATIKAAL